MTWQPDPRPEWVRQINNGSVLPIAAEAARALTVDSLVGDAAVSCGTSSAAMRASLGDDVEPLSVFLRSARTEASLTTLGNWFTRRFVTRLICGRHHLEQFKRDDPGVADEHITAPIIVVGAPRTGTTYLHRLLASDPAARAPLGWELLRPTPPPIVETAHSDPRIAAAEAELAMPQQVASSMLTIHRYSASQAKECLSAMSFSFRSEEFISRYHTPGYVEWYRTADRRPAYDMHRLVLQTLQRRQPTAQWVLKSPVHLHDLDTLLEVYPDAQLIVTHRDPVEMLASVTSLIATLRWAWSDDVDITAIGRYHADLYCTSLDRLVDRCESLIPQGQIAHCRYDDLVAEPVETVEALNGHFGRPTSDAHLAALHEIAAAPRAAPGPHRYDFADLGIDRAGVEQRLSRYRERFGV